MSTFRIGARELLFMGVLAAVPLASYFFVFAPRNAQIATARGEIAAKESQLASLRTVTARIANIDEEIVRWEEALRRLDERLPGEEGVDGILEQITELAKSHDLAVASVKGERPIPAAEYMELPLRTVVEGDFAGFHRFLVDLEALPRITRIHRMNLVRSDFDPSKRNDRGDEARGPLKAEFTLSIYFDPGDAPRYETKGGRNDVRTSK
jgi:Tfp pilus assembly protein PilO